MWKIPINQSANIVSIAVPLSVQCLILSSVTALIILSPVPYALLEVYFYDLSNVPQGKSTDKMKFVLWPVVDKTPARSEVL